MNDDHNSTPTPLPKRRWLRFSLKSLLLLITLVCLVIGPYAHRVNCQKHAVEVLTANGGEFCYSYQAQANPKSVVGSSYSHQVDPPGPRWLRRLIGDDYFITPVRLLISGRDKIEEDCLSRLDALPHLEEMWFADVRLRDSDIVHLGELKKLRLVVFHKGTLSGREPPGQFKFLTHLPRLEVLDLSDSQFGDDDAVDFTGLVNLKHLFLYRTALSDSGMRFLQYLQKLEMLGLSGSSLTDRGIAHIANLQALQYLSVNNCQFTENVIEHLLRMSGLRELEIYDSGLTPAGLTRLREAMPQCRVNGKGGDGTRVVDDPFS